MSKLVSLLFNDNSKEKINNSTKQKPETETNKSVTSLTTSIDDKLKLLFNKNKSNVNKTKDNKDNKDRNNKFDNNKHNSSASKPKNSEKSLNNVKKNNLSKSNLNNNNNNNNKKAVQRMSKKEENLITELKEFDSLNDLFKKLDKNNDFKNLFKTKKKKLEDYELSSSLDKNKYKATSTSEIKRLEAIDQINRNVKIEEVKLLGKKRNISKNFSSINSKIKNESFDENEIYCAKCRVYHKHGLHPKINKQQNIEKIFNDKNIERNLNNNNNKKESNKTDYNISSKLDNIKNKIALNKINNQIKETSKQPSHLINVKKDKNQNNNQVSNNSYSNNNVNQLAKAKLQSIKNQINRGNNIKTSNTTNKTQRNKFHPEDFEDDLDNFIVDDEGEDDYQKHMGFIKKGLRRGREYDYDEDEDDDMEAKVVGFHEIQQEEYVSREIADEEDRIEEAREQGRLKEYIQSKKKRINN